MILITTSRKPSRNTRVFARKMASLLPGSEYVPRGKSSVESLASLSASKGFGKIAVICDRTGNPGKIDFIKVTRSSWEWGDQLPIKGVSSTVKKTRAFSEINADKRFSETFLVESEEDADLTGGMNDNEIFFSLKGEKIMTIKIGGN